MSTDIEKGGELIRAAKRIVLLAHVNPDADAYGSVCGLQLALQNDDSKREVYSVNTSGSLSEYHFLSGVSEVKERAPDGFTPDLIVICDCGDLDRIGDDLVTWVKSQNCPVINIDHHITNTNFGEVNFVDTSVSSTSELICTLLDEWKIALTKDAAECFLAGIIGDTGGFRYRSTTPETLNRAAALMNSGADLPKITTHLYGSVSLTTIKLEAHAMQNLRLLGDDRIAGAVISEEDYKKLGASSSDGENLTERIRDIKGVLISYTIRPRDGAWKVSLRTSENDIDLASVATSFGGGGHKAAAAFRFSKPLDEVLPLLEEKLLALL